MHGVQQSDQVHARIHFNFTLIAVATSSLFFIAAIRPNILRDSELFTLQLICSIPLLLTSAVAAKRSLVSKSAPVFWSYSRYLSIIGYAFIINAIGILVAVLTNWIVVTIFFTINIINPLLYSYLRISYDRNTVQDRIVRDGLFIILIIFLGLIVALRTST